MWNWVPQGTTTPDATVIPSETNHLLGSQKRNRIQEDQEIFWDPDPVEVLGWSLVRKKDIHQNIPRSCSSDYWVVVSTVFFCFLFSSLPGEMIQFDDIIFFRWVEIQPPTRLLLIGLRPMAMKIMQAIFSAYEIQQQLDGWLVTDSSRNGFMGYPLIRSS